MKSTFWKNYVRRSIIIRQKISMGHTNKIKTSRNRPYRTPDFRPEYKNRFPPLVSMLKFHFYTSRILLNCATPHLIQKFIWFESHCQKHLELDNNKNWNTCHFLEMAWFVTWLSRSKRSDGWVWTTARAALFVPQRMAVWYHRKKYFPK